MQWRAWTLDRYVEEWHFPSAQLWISFWTQEMLPRVPNVDRLVILWSMFAIGSALTYLWLFWECATPPQSTQHPGTSLHVISSSRPSPVLVLQAKTLGWEGLGTRLGIFNESNLLQGMTVISIGMREITQKPWKKNHMYCTVQTLGHSSEMNMILRVKVLHWYCMNIIRSLLWDEHDPQSTTLVLYEYHYILPLSKHGKWEDRVQV